MQNGSSFTESQLTCIDRYGSDVMFDITYDSFNIEDCVISYDSCRCWITDGDGNSSMLWWYFGRIDRVILHLVYDESDNLELLFRVYLRDGVLVLKFDKSLQPLNSHKVKYACQERMVM